MTREESFHGTRICEALAVTVGLGITHGETEYVDDRVEVAVAVCERLSLAVPEGDGASLTVMDGVNDTEDEPDGVALCVPVMLEVSERLEVSDGD